MPPVGKDTDIQQTAAALSSADELATIIKSIVTRLMVLEAAVFGGSYTPPS
jgi:hypothetical protein